MIMLSSNPTSSEISTSDIILLLESLSSTTTFSFGKILFLSFKRAIGLTSGDLQHFCVLCSFVVFSLTESAIVLFLAVDYSSSNASLSFNFSFTIFLYHFATSSLGLGHLIFWTSIRSNGLHLQ